MFDVADATGIDVGTIAIYFISDEIVTFNDSLGNAIITALTSTGTLAVANFLPSTSGAAVDANDYILYNIISGALSYNTDGNCLCAAVEFSILGTNTHPTITNANFVIV